MTTTTSQKASYHKGVVLLVHACDRLGSVKASGWTQTRLLSDIYALLHESLESLADVSPNDLSRQLRERLKHQDF